jgi:P27 family predicted phage terminase small subunit
MKKGGRKPKPTRFKLLEGVRQDRINKNEPKPPPTVPDPPEHLDEIARAEWDRLVVKLENCGIMTEIDDNGLAALCTWFSRWVQAERMVQEQGLIVKAPKTKVPMQNPALSIANKAMQEMAKLLAEFGMTPSSRSKVNAVFEKDKSKMAQLID